MRDRQVVIWCSEELRKRWRVFVLDNGFKNGAEALKFLLDLAERLGAKPERPFAF